MRTTQQTAIVWLERQIIGTQEKRNLASLDWRNNAQVRALDGYLWECESELSKIRLMTPPDANIYITSSHPALLAIIGIHAAPAIPALQNTVLSPLPEEERARYTAIVGAYVSSIVRHILALRLPKLPAIKRNRHEVAATQLSLF